MFACALVADNTNFSTELSKYKQSKSILKGMTGYALAERYKNLLPFLSYCASFAHLITLRVLKPSFLIILHVCIGIHVNYVKLETHALPYPP